MAKEQQEYFIKLHDPRFARKELLSNARDVLKILQGHEEFKHLREQRTQLMAKFRKDMNDINGLVFEMKRLFPKTTIQTKRPIIVQQQMAQKPVRELKKLEQELADIENKLGELQ